MLGITPAPRQPLPDYSMNPGEPMERRWSPYSDNGGSTVAVAGEDFVVVASDTRLTNGGFGILSRNVSKMFQLTDESVLAACGCWADVLTLTKLINARIQMYKYSHNRSIKTPSISQMLANMLYAKRFFPYSVRNILAGLDENGKGVVYGYDPVGCMEKLGHAAGGAGVAIMAPLLDNQVGKLNMVEPETGNKVVKRLPTLDEAFNLVHDCFVAAAERQIHVADAINFKIITKTGIEEKAMPLRRD